MCGERMVFNCSNYDLDKTLDSGQNIRAVKQADEFYRIISGRSICRGRQLRDGTIELLTDSKDSMLYWVYVLALNELEINVSSLVSGNPFLEKAVNFSQGIRLLHQDPWESLITFIISQRNSITRILQVVENLCWTAGTAAGNGLYYFPSPSELLAINLDKVGLGYRLPYIVSAAQLVKDGVIHLERLQAGLCDSSMALQELVTIPGVGIKVAACTALFGLGHRDVFPVDVWIERAMQEANITMEDVKGFGEHAGIIQQYIFYYMTHRKLP